MLLHWVARGSDFATADKAAATGVPKVLTASGQPAVAVDSVTLGESMGRPGYMAGETCPLLCLGG